LYRLFNIGTDSAVEIFGQSFIWFLSDCKHFPCQNFPNLESLLQDSFALLWGLTIYVIWKYQMKFKFLSAALAGLFLSFSSVVDAAPVRYDFSGDGMDGSKLSGFVVVNAEGVSAGDDLFAKISSWAFNVSLPDFGPDFGPVFGPVSLASPNEFLSPLFEGGGFRLDANGAVKEAFLCVSSDVRCVLGSSVLLAFDAGDDGLGTAQYFIPFDDNAAEFDGFLGTGLWSGPIPVPEPASLGIFTLGLLGLALRRFKKQS
jgi:hypothetical protein